MLFLGVLALLLIGPKQLPEVARTIGRVLNELKRSTAVLTDEIKSHRDEFVKHVENEREKILRGEQVQQPAPQVQPQPAQPAPPPVEPAHEPAPVANTVPYSVSAAADAKAKTEAHNEEKKPEET